MKPAIARPADLSTPDSGSAASPCVGICQLDPAQVCSGCGRTIGEIAEWSAASDGRRWQIRDAAANRLSIIGQPIPKA